MRHPIRLLLAASAAGALVATAFPAYAGDDVAPRRGLEVVAVHKGATLQLDGHGFGHGHGLSQYGAQGAALQGLTAQQIVTFYYPGTQVTSATGPIRVLLTGDTSDDVVVVNRRHLKVRPVGGAATALPAGPARYRLVAAGPRATRLQALRRGRWRQVRRFAGEAEFVAPGVLSLVTPHGVVGYRGALRSAASRGSGSSARDTVNVPTLEQYLRGVVPREMPASWSPNAVQAQAIAARTYAAFERTEPGSYYDICDTTSCQVYGGASAENPLSDAAVAATAGQILSDAEGPAFTQFSASSGGWTSAGSMPYLVAQADPYDDFAGNPVHSWTRSLTVAGIQAAYPTVGTLQSVQVTARDGNGDWGGRVEQAQLVGTKGTVTVSGDTLRAQFGLRSNWFTISVAARHRR
jgi:SpoIID/LytB domain protein